MDTPFKTNGWIIHGEKHLNGHSSLIKHNMTMNFTPLDSSFQSASFEPKKFTSFFSFKRNSQSTKQLKKTHIFGSHTNKSGLKFV
jgi:hypothetical protein